MNQLAMTENAELAVNQRTKDLIVRGVSENTLKAYRRALKALEAWMHDAENGLTDLTGSNERIANAIVYPVR